MIGALACLRFPSSRPGRQNGIPAAHGIGHLPFSSIPRGSSLAYTNEKAAQMEKIILASPGVGHCFVTSRRGRRNQQGMCFCFPQGGVGPDHGQAEIMETLRRDLTAKIPDAFPSFLSTSRAIWRLQGRADIELSVRGNDYSVLKPKVAELTRRFAESGLMSDIKTTCVKTHPKCTSNPLRNSGAQRRQRPKHPDTIDAAIARPPRQVHNDAQRYDVRMRLVPEQRRTPDEITSSSSARATASSFPSPPSPLVFEDMHRPSCMRCASAPSASTSTSPAENPSTKS